MTEAETSRADRRRERRRSRPERLLDNYGLVLILLVAAFLAMAASQAQVWRIAMVLLAGAALLATYWASNVRRRTMTYVTVFVMIATVAALLAESSRTEFQNEFLLIALGALFAAGPWVILRRIFQAHKTVTLQTILGAICAYVYLGLTFAVVFATAEVIDPDPFFAQTDTPLPGDFSYFSFVTITTLGYGDLSPNSQAGQQLAVLEALIGSLYLVTLVGRLVGMYGMQETGLAKDDTAD